MQMRKWDCSLHFYTLATQPIILKFCVHIVRTAEKDTLFIITIIAAFDHVADETTYNPFCFTVFVNFHFSSANKMLIVLWYCKIQ